MGNTTVLFTTAQLKKKTIKKTIEKKTTTAQLKKIYFNFFHLFIFLFTNKLSFLKTEIAITYIVTTSREFCTSIMYATITLQHFTELFSQSIPHIFLCCISRDTPDYIIP